MPATLPRVNDPDPRPRRTRRTPCCDAPDPEGLGFVCTLEPGHGGPAHVAGTGVVIAHVWPR